MKRILTALTNERFIRFLVYPHVLFFIVAWFTDAPNLIGVLNPVDIALSIAVCVAFMPSLIEMIWRSERPDSAGMMVAGIVLGWGSNALRSIWSALWRAMGMPEWLANTDITSYILFMLGYGAICHLVAPDAIAGQIPTRRWIKVGIWVGVGVLTAISLSHQREVFGAVEWMHPPHDTGGRPVGAPH